MLKTQKIRNHLFRLSCLDARIEWDEKVEIARPKLKAIVSTSRSEMEFSIQNLHLHPIFWHQHAANVKTYNVHLHTIFSPKTMTSTLSNQMSQWCLKQNQMSANWFSSSNIYIFHWWIWYSFVICLCGKGKFD